jgi:hypothetical protein
MRGLSGVNIDVKYVNNYILAKAYSTLILLPYRSLTISKLSVRMGGGGGGGGCGAVRYEFTSYI